MNIPVEAKIHLNKFKPRDYQIPIFKAFFEDHYRRMVVILGRRAGKDLCTWNIVIREAITRPGVYFYVFPTYAQGKKIIWSSVTIQGERFTDYIPKQLIHSMNSQEMKVILTNGSIIQLIGSDNPDCFDNKTEILTENGWKLFKDLNKDEKVATLKDGHLIYDRPTAYIEKKYSGEMYRGCSGSFDFLVTPTHRFYVRSDKGFYKFKNVKALSLSGDSVPSTCLWKGEERGVFAFPGIVSEWTCGKGRACKKVYDRTLKMEDFVSLLGIFLAEGNTFKSKKTYRVTISQKKEDSRLKIEELLNRCGFRYSSYGINYCIEDRQLYEYFSQFGKQPYRFIPKDIKNLSVKYLKILFDWLVLGDGSVHKNNGGITYYSTSKRLIDDVQEIAIKLGRSGNISIKNHIGDKHWFGGENRFYKNKHTLYVFGVRNSKFKRFASSKKSYITKEYYAGSVYCVSVQSGVIKVRRNGKEMWAGNSIVGTNPRGVVFSEYALQNPRVYALMAPILAANKGWAIFQSTPRGKNHFWDLYQLAENSPDWWTCKLGLDVTKHIDPKEIDREVEEGLMSPDLVQQEYYSSFLAGVEGSYYCKYVDKMRLNNQIGVVPWEPAFQVHTAWDIGVRDSTSIIFFQTIGQTVRIIDSYEKNKEGLEHYVKHVLSKDYTYGKHIGPHDIAVQEFGSGVTRIEKAKQLGIRFTVASKISIMDGIETVRSTLGKMWIDEEKCKKLVRALENYRQEYDSKRQVYKDKPLHDIFSNFCDALRYLCISLPKTRDGMSADELDSIRNQAMYGEQSSLPSFFRDGMPKF